MEKDRKQTLNDSFLDLDLGIDDQETELSEEDKEILSTEESKEKQDETFIAETEGAPEKEEQKTQEEEEEKETTEQETAEQQSQETEEEKEEKASDGETPLHLHAAIMKERGLLPSSFDATQVKGETLEDQIDAIADEIEKGYEDRYSGLKGSLDELSQEVLSKIEKGWSEEEAKQSVVDRAKIEKIDDSTLEENETLQEDVLREYLKKSGVPDKNAERYVKRMKDNDSLYEEAKEARDSLPEVYKQEDQMREQQVKQEQQQREKQKEEMLEKFENQLSEYKGKEIYPGVKVTDKDITNIKNILLKPVKYEERDGKQIPVSREMQLKRENPVEYWIKWAALDNLGYFDKDADLSKIKKRQETKATKTLSDYIEKNKEKQKKATGFQKKEEEKSDEIKMPNILKDIK